MTASIVSVPGAISQLELRDHARPSLVRLAPSRGGMATRFVVDGHEVFFLDEASFLDTSRNVRGGNPVLFPTPGKLTDDRWARDGHLGQFPQHGFARKLPWRVADQGTGDHPWVTLRLEDSAETSTWPWAFCADFTYRLRGDTLRIDMEVTNRGSTTMPCGLGFHPYFLVPQSDKAATTITTQASSALDNRTGATVPFTGFDLDSDEVDLHLNDHGSTASELRAPGWSGAVELRGSEAFTHWVVWTLRGRDFVCVEPWTCPGDAMNTADRLLRISPGATHTEWLEIRYPA